MKRWSRVHIRAVENAVIVLELKAVEKHGGENAEVWHCVDFFFSESQHWLSWRTQTVGDGVKPWWRRSKLVTQDQFREIDDLCSVLCDRNQSCRPFPESKHHLNQHNLSKTTFICVLFFSFSVALTSLKAPARRRVEMILLLQPKKTAWKQTFFFFFKCYFSLQSVSVCSFRSTSGRFGDDVSPQVSQLTLTVSS